MTCLLHGELPNVFREPFYAKWKTVAYGESALR